MHILNYPAAELGRIIEVREKSFGFSAVLVKGPTFNAKPLHRGGNIRFWQRDVLLARLAWMLVLPASINHHIGRVNVYR